MNGGNSPGFLTFWEGFKVLLVGDNSKFRKAYEAKKRRTKSSVFKLMTKMI
jgi:hypothetical protein